MYPYNEDLLLKDVPYINVNRLQNISDQAKNRFSFFSLVYNVEACIQALDFNVEKNEEEFKTQSLDEKAKNEILRPKDIL